MKTTLTKIEPTERPGYYLVTFASGRQIIVVSAPISAAYFSDSAD